MSLDQQQHNTEEYENQKAMYALYSLVDILNKE